MERRLGGDSKERSRRETQRGMIRWDLVSRAEGTCVELWEIQGDSWIGAFIYYSKISFEHLLYARHCTRHKELYDK